jgi:hypothetical protein
MTEAAIQVEGWRELARTFGRLSAELRAELRAEMLEVAGMVADAAKQIAEQKGLRESGRLIDGIRPGTRNTTAVIRDRAKRISRKYPAGYPYPARYEYGDRDRPFLRPAVEEKRDEVVAMLEQMLDRLAGLTGF